MYVQKETKHFIFETHPCHVHINKNILGLEGSLSFFSGITLFLFFLYQIFIQDTLHVVISRPLNAFRQKKFFVGFKGLLIKKLIFEDYGEDCRKHTFCW